MSHMQYHQLTEQIEALSWKVDQLFNEVDAQVCRLQGQIWAALEIHERIAALEQATRAPGPTVERVPVASDRAITVFRG